MGENDQGLTHSAEYKYQIWLLINCDKSDKDVALEMTEMARILRILPQSLLNESLPGNSVAVAELDDYCNTKSFSKSFMEEFVIYDLHTKSFDGCQVESPIKGTSMRLHPPSCLSPNMEVRKWALGSGSHPLIPFLLLIVPLIILKFCSSFASFPSLILLNLLFSRLSSHFTSLLFHISLLSPYPSQRPSRR